MSLDLVEEAAAQRPPAPSGALLTLEAEEIIRRARAIELHRAGLSRPQRGALLSAWMTTARPPAYLDWDVVDPEITGLTVITWKDVLGALERRGLVERGEEYIARYPQDGVALIGEQLRKHRSRQAFCSETGELIASALLLYSQGERKLQSLLWKRERRREALAERAVGS